MIKRKYAAMIVIAITVLILSACDTKGEEPDLGHVDDDTIVAEYNDDDALVADRLVIWWDTGSGVSYKTFAEEALNKRYPKTRFQFTEFTTYMRPSYLDMMKSKPSPDLIVFDTRFLPLMIETDYLEPIPDMYGVEMDYDTITELRASVSDLSLYVLPFGRIGEGLFYNKKVFDERNIPYPKDGMTWDEVIELAKVLKSSRRSPIDVSAYDSMASQLSLRMYDPETGQLDFESEEWKELTRILIEINDLDEYSSEIDGNGGSLSLSFSKGDFAMVAGPLFGHGFLKTGFMDFEGNLTSYEVDWDMVSFPVFDDEQRLRPADYLLGIGIPKGSPNKEDALKVLRYLLSREVQEENSRKGLISMRADAGAFADDFGSFSILAGKSVSSLLSEGPKGERDPVFEHLDAIGKLLSEMVYLDDSWRDVAVEKAQGRISEIIPIIMKERQKYIEEIRSKF
jgi:ABC-type glycerol-3-phosphate transport system substrate-binding protein